MKTAVMIYWSIGIVLLLWVAWDLYSGEVWLHRAFHRDEEPLGYWLGIVLWTLAALSFFVTGHG